MRFFRRSEVLSHTVVLLLNDPQLAEHARQLADFAAHHSGEGHELRKVLTRQRGQTIVCRCGVPAQEESPDGAMLALMEDEIIDDDPS